MPGNPTDMLVEVELDGPGSPALVSEFNPSTTVSPVLLPLNMPPVPPQSQPFLDLDDGGRAHGASEEKQGPDDRLSEPVILPHQHYLTVITNLSESLPLAEFEPLPIDVDRWELVFSPAEYLALVQDTLAPVRLIDWFTPRTMAAHKGGPAFDDWLLLAVANHQLWVSLTYKEPFFNSLARYQIGRLPHKASLGSVHLSTSLFNKCLQDAGCDTFRLKTCGQKTPINKQFIPHEPAHPNHRWTRYNEWDIGRTFCRRSSGCLLPLSHRLILCLAPVLKLWNG